MATFYLAPTQMVCLTVPPSDLNWCLSLTAGYVFENLPGGVFNDTVRLFLSLELTLTFPIVFKPASEVMEEIWQNMLMV